MRKLWSLQDVTKEYR